MQGFIKFVLLCVTGFLIMFPYGQLYARGKVGPYFAASLGALMGLAAGLILGWPRYEPREASIVATIAIMVITSTVLGGSVVLLRRMGLPSAKR